MLVVRPSVSESNPFPKSICLLTAKTATSWLPFVNRKTERLQFRECMADYVKGVFTVTIPVSYDNPSSKVYLEMGDESCKTISLMDNTSMTDDFGYELITDREFRHLMRKAIVKNCFPIKKTILPGDVSSPFSKEIITGFYLEVIIQLFFPSISLYRKGTKEYRPLSITVDNGILPILVDSYPFLALMDSSLQVNFALTLMWQALQQSEVYN